MVEALVPDAAVEVHVRFLHPMAREIGVSGDTPGEWAEGAEFHVVPELRVDGQLFQTWHETVERDIKVVAGLSQCVEQPLQMDFHFPATRTIEPIHDQRHELKGLIVRRQKAVAGRVELLATSLHTGVFKLTVRVLNQTPVTSADLENSEAVLLRTFASTHTILHVSQGAFVSLMSPPAELTKTAETCQNMGTWPVLVGDEEKSERDTMLSSPIILYDYPKIAPESPGPLFDGTEIDEILTLRVLTLTDEEKGEMRRVDEQARRLLERTEALPEDSFLKMHGTMRAGPSQGTRQRPSTSEPKSKDARAPSQAPGPARLASGDPTEFDDFFGANRRLTGVYVGGAFLQAGDQVRLRPKKHTDVLDLATTGQTAIVEAVEQDLEQRIHLAVVLENDPGKDLGLLRQPGHRFFYGVDEVEPLGGQA